MEQVADRGGGLRYLGYVMIAGIGAGAALRFVNLGGQSLWVDELITIKNSHIGEPNILSWVLHNLQGPAVSLITHFLARLSLSEALLRLPSAIAGAATVPAMYFLCRELLDRWTSLNTVFLLALSPIHIWYSQELRGYAFVILFSVLSTYFLIRWTRRRRPRDITLYAVFLFAGLVSNLSMAFLAAVHFLYLLIQCRRPRLLLWWLVAVAVVLVAFSPWIQEIAARVHPERVMTGGPVEPLVGGSRLSAMAVPYSLFAFGVGYSYGPSTRELQTNRGGALRRNLGYIVLAGLVLGIPLLVGLVHMARADVRLLSVVLVWMALPALAVTALAFRNIKVFNPRYLLISLPAFLILMGHGLASMTRGRLHVYIVPVAALLVYSIINYFAVPYYAKDDLRAAARAIREAYSENDVVAAVYTAEPLEFYLRGFADVEVFELDDLRDRSSMEARCRQLASSGERVWLSQCREWQVDPEGIIKGWFDENMGLVSHETYPGVNLFLYGGGVVR